MVWLITAAMCVVYYIVTLVAAGFSGFSLIWLLIAALFCGVGGLRRAGAKGCIVVPKTVRWLFLGIFFIGMVLFVVIEGMIIKTALAKPEKNADYVIILGAQVKGDYPSQILRLRIMKAVAYLKDNPDTKVIVSGGKGSGEWISEAECMRRVLLECDIAAERIIVEDRSVNTMENLENSMDIVGKEHRFVIATCNFHQYRAQCIAKKLGAREVSGIASRSNIPLLPNYFLREFFAVIKYYIFGEI